MTKSREETVAEFDELVNMTADELEAWLETEASQTTGQPNPSSAVRPRSPSEPVGHASGRHILSILRRGGASSLPASDDADDGEANDDGGDLAHARRTVAYLRRHLAQEREANAAKSADELEKTKSYRSLKNWGHDALKERNKGGSSSSGGEGKEKGEGAADGEKKTPAKTTTPAKRKAAGRKADGKETDDDDDDDNEDDDEAAEEQPDNDAAAAAAEGEEGEDDDDNDEGGVDDEDDKDRTAQGSEEDDEVEDDEDEDDAEEPKAKKAKRS